MVVTLRLVAESITSRVVKVLMGLRMLSEGSTYTWNATRTTSTKTPPIPIRFTGAGDLSPHDESPYEFHHRRLNSSTTREELGDRLLAAEKALRAAHGHYDKLASDVPNKPGELRLYVLIDCRGMKAVDVAEKVQMSLTWVRTLRLKAGKRPNDGEPLDRWIDP